MARGYMPSTNFGSHKVAVSPFGGEVDRGRRPRFAARDLAQIERAADVASRFTD